MYELYKKVSLKTTAKCNPLTHSVVMYEDIFFITVYLDKISSKLLIYSLDKIMCPYQLGNI